MPSALLPSNPLWQEVGAGAIPAFLFMLLFFFVGRLVAFGICRSMCPRFRNCVAFASCVFGSVWHLLVQCYVICCFFDRARFGLLQGPIQ